MATPLPAEDGRALLIDKLVSQRERLVVWSLRFVDGNQADAEDLVQDACAWALGYDGEVRGPLHAWRLLWLWVRRRAIDARRHRDFGATRLAMLRAEAADGERYVDQRETLARVLAALRQLRPADGAALAATALGFDSIELGRELGVAASTIRARVHRARRRLVS